MRQKMGDARREKLRYLRGLREEYDSSGDSRGAKARARGEVDRRASAERGSGAEDFPEAVRAFLTECCLLYHTPLLYLLPEQDMIGPEELRFFTLDRRWVLAYLDGLCSVGRSASISYAHDEELLELLYRAAMKAMPSVRQGLLGMGAEGEENAWMDAEEICSGFLLCSDLVKGWRGLEFKAFDVTQPSRDTKPLQILRLDTIRPDLLFGLFRGEIKRLEIAQPPEGLHFGFSWTETDPAGAARPVKAVRDLETGRLLQREADAALKDGGKNRVVDVLQTKKNLEGVMGKAEGTFTSAEFALEMIQNAYTGVFTMKEDGGEEGGAPDGTR